METNVIRSQYIKLICTSKSLEKFVQYCWYYNENLFQINIMYLNVIYYI